MTNCTITLDVTGFGYTYLLQLDSMLGDFLEDGDNAAAADALHDWMLENARNFTDDARANGDTLAADIFSDMAAEDEDGNDPEEPAAEEPASTCQTIEADDKKAEDLEDIAIRRGLEVSIICNTNAGGYTTSANLIGPEADVSALLRAYEREEATRPSARDHNDALDAVTEYLGCPEGEFLKEILAEASLDVKQDHTNLFKAGQFEGTARMLAAAIVNDGANKNESVATITRAVYDYCGIGW